MRPRLAALAMAVPGPAPSPPCAPLSAHGFLGLDAAVVERIARWMGAR